MSPDSISEFSCTSMESSAEETNNNPQNIQTNLENESKRAMQTADGKRHNYRSKSYESNEKSGHFNERLEEKVYETTDDYSEIKETLSSEDFNLENENGDDKMEIDDVLQENYEKNCGSNGSLSDNEESSKNFDRKQLDIGETSEEIDKRYLEISVSDENGSKSKLDIDFDVNGDERRRNNELLSRNCRSSESSDLSDSDSNNSVNLNAVCQEERRCSTGGLLDKKIRGGREARSMSDGAAAIRLDDEGDVIVFPSLQDNVLENMGLLGEITRERLTEEEIESKFQALTLAFTIDSVTLTERRERQRRQRDQAENNMRKELDKLALAIHRLNPLCIDAEKTELVTSLHQQLDIVEQASERISTSAEIFGSVQQEWRMAESCSLMLSHLKNLKRQRDAARRQLQCTKRMLQSSTEVPVNRNGRSASVITGEVPPSETLASTRRRASIATIQRPNSETRLLGGGTLDPRRLPRRTSGELSPRLWDQRRLDWSSQANRRPTRLDLGIDLGKIREGTVEQALNYEEENHSDENQEQIDTDFLEMHELVLKTNEETNSSSKLDQIYQEFFFLIQQCWQSLPNEYLCLISIFTFTIFTIIIANLLIEVEYARKGNQMDAEPFKLDELFGSYAGT